jgi:hypothetical protein
MSRYGALSLHRHGQGSRNAQAASADLPPIAEGAWAAWAQRQQGLTFDADDHSLTDYPCRLPNGSIGRVAVVQQGEDWALVCRAA